jgi:hypothetical protein
MKKILVIGSFMILAACNQQTGNTQQLQARVDSLQKKLDNSYKPGFGEFMSSIQVHHAKLWFAGINNNWDLADFEVHEIQESLDDIQEFNKDRPEVKAIGMISPAIDSVNQAIKLKDQQSFKSSYILLTNSCNNCHKATEHAFNVIIIPTNPPVSNQRFNLEK